MLGKPGPFQIISSSAMLGKNCPSKAPRRRYSCPNYDVCLDMAAALNWDSFSCRGCSGALDQSLLWQAHQARKHDSIANSLCTIPEIQCIPTAHEHEEENPMQVVNK